MIELSNRFCLLEPADAKKALLLGHDIAPDISARQFSACSPIIFNQNPEESDNGVVWNISFRAVTSDPAILQYRDAKLYLAFFMSDASLRVVGTHDSVPTISVAPYNGSRYLVQVSFKSPDAILL